MREYEKYLKTIPESFEAMVEELSSWIAINSGSANLEGLSQMSDALKRAFSKLDAEIEEIPLPSFKSINEKGEPVEIPVGSALHMVKRKDAKIQVLLGGHMDTVFSQTSSFQKATRLDHDTLLGPGVIDMKGGLMILLKSLETLERSPFAKNIGWHVVINPDEEIGSPSSSTLFKEVAKKCHLGLLFEPSLPDGSLVSARKGSMNFTVIAKGKSAHAGRDFHLGVNAISALSQFILQAEELSDVDHGITINIGKVLGGEGLNIVPELALCGLNVRMIHPEDMPQVKEQLLEIVRNLNTSPEISFSIHECSTRPPKPFEKKHKALFESMKCCATELGTSLSWESTGGVTDGNLLFSVGLPNIDSLGGIGGGMHTHDEFLLLTSLVERSKLVSFFLMKLANGELSLEEII